VRASIACQLLAWMGMAQEQRFCLHSRRASISNRLLGAIKPESCHPVNTMLSAADYAYRLHGRRAMMAVIPSRCGRSSSQF